MAASTLGGLLFPLWAQGWPSIDCGCLAVGPLFPSGANVWARHATSGSPLNHQLSFINGGIDNENSFLFPLLEFSFPPLMTACVSRRGSAYEKEMYGWSKNSFLHDWPTEGKKNRSIVRKGKASSCDLRAVAFLSFHLQADQHRNYFLFFTIHRFLFIIYFSFKNWNLISLQSNNMPKIK